MAGKTTERELKCVFVPQKQDNCHACYIDKLMRHRRHQQKLRNTQTDARHVEDGASPSVEKRKHHEEPQPAKVCVYSLWNMIVMHTDGATTENVHPSIYLPARTGPQHRTHIYRWVCSLMCMFLHSGGGGQSGPLESSSSEAAVLTVLPPKYTSFSKDPSTSNWLPEVQTQPPLPRGSAGPVQV